MIQANCRARFTAADFDFVVRTLARSQSESVSLVDLLSDSETRDSVLDSPRLVQTILCNDVQLRISSQFYFYVLARYVLRDAGIRDRKLCDYVGSLLENFSRAHALHGPQVDDESPRQYLSDMDNSTSSRHLSSFASIPTTHFSVKASATFPSSRIDSRILCAITGIITLSSKFPFAPAQVMVASFPKTCAHTIIIDSHKTGFTFPGMSLIPISRLIDDTIRSPNCPATLTITPNPINLAGVSTPEPAKTK